MSWKSAPSSQSDVKMGGEGQYGVTWKRTFIVCVNLIAHGFSPFLCQETKKLMAMKNTRQLVSKDKGGVLHTVMGTFRSL